MTRTVERSLERILVTKCLALLSLRGPCGASDIGGHLWPERAGRVVSANGGGDYAAQMFLGRLRKRGLVMVVNGKGSSRWGLTSAGARHLALATAR